MTTQQHLQQALEIYENLGEKAGIAACLRRMASLQDDINAPAKSQEILNRSLALYTQLGDTAGMASAYDSLAKVLIFAAILPPPASFTSAAWNCCAPWEIAGG